MNGPLSFELSSLLIYFFLGDCDLFEATTGIRISPAIDIGKEVLRSYPTAFPLYAYSTNALSLVAATRHLLNADVPKELRVSYWQSEPTLTEDMITCKSFSSLYDRRPCLTIHAIHV